jgi:uroporphyrinogen-III synthase
MSRPVVLNTRPAEQAWELTQRLLSAGFDVAEAPAIAVVPAWDAATFEEIRSELDQGAFAWIVIGSQNAGRGLEDELRAQSGRVLCGPATATALELTGASALERFSAAAALAVLRPRVSRGERVLAPRAAEGRQELVDGLRELGVHVVAPLAYRTVPSSAAAERLRQGDVDVLTLCSPSAVNAVAGSVPDTILVVCLGKTTADAAHARGLAVARVAAQPTMAAVVAAIQASLAVHA